MESSDPYRADLDRFVEPFREGQVKVPEGDHHAGHHTSHDGTFTTVREAEHRDKKIVVKTTYEITIDGAPLDAHVMVMNDGTVHYHGLPNYSFGSALDMVKRALDAELTDPPHDEIGGRGDHDAKQQKKGGHHGH